MNPFIERFLQSLRAECLDHFLVLGERYLHHLGASYVEHYHLERQHQSRGNVPLCEADEEPHVLKFPTGAVRCRRRLGGLLKHYCRAA
jgi:hypothetical protein